MVFGPRTAKSQPIWVKYCTHVLLLYGIHQWADLDRDRRVGGSRPNQNDYVFFCNTCNASSYTKTTDRLDFGGKPSKFEDGCYREKFRNIVAWAEPDPKTAFFSRFRVPIRYPAHSLQETVLPQTNGTGGKPRLRRCEFC